MDTTYMKPWVITVAKNALFTDIDILSQGYSKVGVAGENVMRTDRISTDTLATNDAHIIKRLIDHRANDIRRVMAKFLFDPSAIGAASDAPNMVDYTFQLYVPTEADDSMLTALADLCHDYMVAGALADWYSYLGAGNIEELKRKAADSLSRIRDFIYYRPLP